MKILAVDSSAKVSSGAICDENKVIAQYSINTSLTHSQTLMPMITALLNNAEICLDDIDYFAVSNGPGSFTGLRIGIAAIKGMSFANDKPCIGVSTLEALAYNATFSDGIICAAMDARCNQVYTALFESKPGEKIKRLTEDMAIAIDNLSEMLGKYNKNIFFVGDGALLCYNNVKSINRKFLMPPVTLLQNAASVAFTAIEYIHSERCVKSEDLLAEYLRLPQAQRELKKKQKIKEDEK